MQFSEPRPKKNVVLQRLNAVVTPHMATVSNFNGIKLLIANTFLVIQPVRKVDLVTSWCAAGFKARLSLLVF